MESFKNADGKSIVLAMIDAIHSNAAYLSEVDGAIGDGDHGINMDKGFTRTRAVLGDQPMSFTDSLSALSDVLMVEIGGSMGPLYGTLFMEMADAGAGSELIDAPTFGRMLAAGLAGVQDIGSAKLGDKTLLDTLIPAEEAFRLGVESGQSFSGALADLRTAAEAGKESTRDLVAKVGRASRLGERSRGVLDAGATSCYLILDAMAKAIDPLLAA